MHVRPPRAAGQLVGAAARHRSPHLLCCRRRHAAALAAAGCAREGCCGRCTSCKWTAEGHECGGTAAAARGVHSRPNGALASHGRRAEQAHGVPAPPGIAIIRIATPAARLQAAWRQAPRPADRLVALQQLRSHPGVVVSFRSHLRGWQAAPAGQGGYVGERRCWRGPGRLLLPWLRLERPAPPLPPRPCPLPQIFEYNGSAIGDRRLLGGPQAPGARVAAMWRLAFSRDRAAAACRRRRRWPTLHRRSLLPLLLPCCVACCRAAQQPVSRPCLLQWPWRARSVWPSAATCGLVCSCRCTTGRARLHSAHRLPQPHCWVAAASPAALWLLPLLLLSISLTICRPVTALLLGWRSWQGCSLPHPSQPCPCGPGPPSTAAADACDRLQEDLQDP